MNRRWPFLGVSFLAGFAALALETIWIREVGLVAGRTAVSASLVLAVFFTAAGLGAWAGGRRAVRAPRPAQMAGWGLIGAAGCALAGFLLLRFGKEAVALPAWVWAVVTAGPASALIGTVFPCLAEVFVTAAPKRTACGGGFYAADLAGGACGVALGGVALPMALGYGLALGAAVAVLFLAGTAAILLGRNAARQETIAPSPLRQPDLTGSPDPSLPAWWGVLALAGSGFLSLGAEMLAVQWLLLLTDESVYSVAAVLCAFLVNLSAGAALATTLRRRNVPGRVLLVSALFLGGAGALATPYVWARWIGQDLWATGDRPLWNTARLLGATTLALLPLVVCLGAVFPLAWEMAERRARHQGAALGRMLVINKLACAVGAVAVPLALVPLVGISVAFGIVGSAYAALGLLAVWTVPQWRRNWAGAATAVCIGAMAAGLWWAPVPLRLRPGERLLGLVHDAQGVVAAVEDAGGSRHVVLHQTYTLNGTGRALLSQRNEAWLPLALAPRRDRVLFIGMASGISADAVLDFPVSTLVTAEVLPGVARVARTYFAPWNAQLFADPRAKVVVDDGRHALRATTEPWDVVICDLMLPWAEGTAGLYGRDFFREVRDRLGKGGVFCLWLPMYQMDAATAGVVARTFRDEFPCALAVRGNFDPVAPIVGLVGSSAPFDLGDETLAARLAQVTNGAAEEASPFLRSPAHLRLALVGDLRPAAALERWSVNTDDRPVIAFLAPQAARAATTLRGIKLLEWCDAHVPPREFSSCRMDGVEPEAAGRSSLAASALKNSALAGANYFAAAVMRVPLPDEATQAAREARAAFHLDRARQLAPAAMLEIDDLGR